jgi:glycosyltransferase involved in cell wall biosynthesis
MNPLPKLLYLGFAFPPGVSGLFPEAQPAGHLIETSLVNSIRRWFDVRSVCISWMDLQSLQQRDSSPGLPSALNLLDRPPELYYRWQSLRQLKHAYGRWVASGWTPDIVLVCNFAPVYNALVRWLKPQPGSPAMVQYLADSVDLQRPLPWTRRLRYLLKPFKWIDAEMVSYFDACVAVSRSTEAFYSARQMPWLWLPSGCSPERAIRFGGDDFDGPIRLGYFGTLASHAGVPQLLKAFTAEPRSAQLHICGYGKDKDKIAVECQGFSNVHLHPPRTPDECVRFARSCDLMINPRPIVPGNENNFSSKVFEYALSGRSILTSRLSGVDHVLGPHAYYFDSAEYDTSLRQALTLIGQAPRTELRRRGVAIQDRVLTEFSWETQGQRLAEFLHRLIPKEVRIGLPDSARPHPKPAINEESKRFPSASIGPRS